MVVARLAHQLAAEVHHRLDVLVAHLRGLIEPPLERLVVVPSRFQIHADVYLTHAISPLGMMRLVRCHTPPSISARPTGCQSTLREISAGSGVVLRRSLDRGRRARDDRPIERRRDAAFQLRCRASHDSHASQEDPA